MSQDKFAQNALNGAPATYYPSPCKPSSDKSGVSQLAPSGFPAKHQYYPSKAQLAALSKEQRAPRPVNLSSNLSRLDDPAIFFKNALPNVRVYSFRGRRVGLCRASTDLTHPNRPPRPPGGGRAEVVALLVEASPRVFKNAWHLDPNLDLGGFPDRGPLGAGTWYRPKWGWGVTGALFGPRKGPERAIKGLVGYLFFKAGEYLLSGKFRRVLDDYRHTLTRENPDVAPYPRGARGGYVVRAQAAPDGGAAEVSGWFDGQGFFDACTAVIEELSNGLEPLLTAAAPVTGAVGYLAALAFTAVSFFINYNYQALALFAQGASWAALFIFSKASATAGFVLHITYYPRLFLNILYFVTSLLATNAMWKFFMFSIFISFESWLIWLALVGMSYIAIYAAERGYADRRHTKIFARKSLHKHVLALVGMLPIGVSLVLGLTSILPMRIQRWLAIALLGYCAARLWATLLVFWRTLRGVRAGNNCAGPLPRVLRLRSFYLTRAPVPRRAGLTSFDRYSLFRKYPLVPSWIYKIINESRSKLGAIIFFSLGITVAVTFMIVSCLLAINLEGALGCAALGQS